MPVWNPIAIDYDYPVILCDDGTIKGTKIGFYVMTTEEAEKVLLERHISSK